MSRVIGIDLGTTNSVVAVMNGGDAEVTLGAAMTRLITRNTTIPTRKSEVFSTAEDGQSVVTVHVLQGEREMAADNRSLGRFNLEGIVPAPRGVPQIEVTFEIDANGILNVSAKDLNTGRQQAITVTASSGLTEQEVQRLVQEAKKNEATDRRRREEVDQRNKADAFNYEADKLLREHGDRLPAHERSALEEALSEAKDAAKQSDPATIRSTQERLQGLVHRISESLYRSQQAKSQPSGSQHGPRGSGGYNRPGRSTGGDDVIDAEFE